jgi:hypothetical protein
MVEGNEHPIENSDTQTLLNNFQRQLRTEDKPTFSEVNGNLPHSGN